MQCLRVFISTACIAFKLCSEEAKYVLDKYLCFYFYKVNKILKKYFFAVNCL